MFEGGIMFENDKEIVDALLNDNKDFRRLYNKHSILKNTVKEANEGNVSMDQLSLEELKKAKLDLKDRMTFIIENHKHEHA
jgi:uncharacterized protein YdcH (DUF465 family)